MEDDMTDTERAIQENHNMKMKNKIKGAKRYNKAYKNEGIAKSTRKPDDILDYDSWRCEQ